MERSSSVAGCSAEPAPLPRADVCVDAIFHRGAPVRSILGDLFYPKLDLLYPGTKKLRGKGTQERPALRAKRHDEQNAPAQ